MSKILLLITIILMDLLSGMEFDLFVPSFPQLQAHFGVTSFWIEALLSVNFIGYCLSLFFVGALADRYGRKPMLLIGLSIFVFGSILCVGVSSYESLLIGRFLQGVGVAAPAILSFLIISDNYPLEKQQHFMALLNGTMNLAVGLAPVLGSYITLHFNWQGNFIALLGLGIFVLLMTLFFIPNYQLAKVKDKGLLGGYIEIFRSPPLLLLISHIILMIVPYWVFVGISPLLYIQELGVSLHYFGYYQGSLALFFALGCFVFSRIISRLSQENWIRVSAIILSFSLLSLSIVTMCNTKSPLFITLMFLPFIIGQIIPSIILYPLCLQYKPEAKGQVSAMIQGGRLIVCALTLQIAGYYYEGSFQGIGLILLMLISLVVTTALKVIRDWSKFDNTAQKC